MKFCTKLGLFIGIVLVSIATFATDLAVLTNGYTIRHERREIVGGATRLYLGTDSSSYVDIPTNEIQSFEKDLTPVRVPAAAPSIVPKKSQPVPIAVQQKLPPLLKPQEITDLVNSAGDRHHIDPDFINSVIHAESGFNSRAVSSKGAQGLMQLMPNTASGLGVTNAFDAGANVEGGTRYLRELLERYNYDVVKALAAYNAGPMRVDHYHGVPPYYETQAYIARIIKDFNRKKLAERKAAAKTKITQVNPRTVAGKTSPQNQAVPPSLALNK
ncbi:MAG TPA: lytic transglycosylase domain-containing protein [Terriglobales bacterium]|nr:lytic transglycosylase domain-containing protein [Terriglobales bacterium]